MLVSSTQAALLFLANSHIGPRSSGVQTQEQLPQVQEELLSAAYSDEALCLPTCGVALDSEQRYLWRGPRVRMGLCQDRPQAIVPHSTSGRADYFGSAVNR